MDKKYDIDDSEYAPHNKMMFYFFMSCTGSEESQHYHLEKGLSWLRSGKVNPHEYDNQLIRELRVRRWIPEYQEKIYGVLASQCSAIGCTENHY